MKNSIKKFGNSTKTSTEYLLIIGIIAALLTPIIFNVRLNQFDYFWAGFWVVVALLATLQAFSWFIKSRDEKK